MAVSCENVNDLTFSEVEITPVFTDSLSIRAISPMDENAVWFAANKGIVGLIDGTTPKIATVKYKDSILHFRSIARTAQSVFVLSIENPAVLYKLDYADKEATTMTEVYIEENEKVFYDAISFFDDLEGIAMGDPIDGCLSVIKTIDGGKSWFKLSCNILPAVEEGEAAFAASNSNIAIHENNIWIVSGGKRARVFYSPDRGANWEVYNTPIIQGQTMTGIYSVDFYDENLGVIFGGDWEKKDFNEGNKAITTDGGKTWKLISNGKGPGYRSSVKFVPGSNGNELVAVGSPGVSYSSDKGQTWTALSNQGFYAIEFLNDSIAFASGNHIIAKLLFK
ncbi:putative oxidoreductase [unidentified eubacterium SCB49]|nr:putative oxidoreductase [unidentified eubacterium SCB49]